jgi:hypothetical protein
MHACKSIQPLHLRAHKTRVLRAGLCAVTKEVKNLFCHSATIFKVSFYTRPFPELLEYDVQVIVVQNGQITERTEAPCLCDRCSLEPILRIEKAIVRCCQICPARFVISSTYADEIAIIGRQTICQAASPSGYRVIHGLTIRSEPTNLVSCLSSDCRKSRWRV